MPAPWLVAAGIQAGASVLDYLGRRRNRTPSFQKSPYGSYLKQVGEQGAYSTQMRKNILSRTAMEGGNVAGGRKAALRGYLESRNMGGSIAGARLLDTPTRQLQAQVGDAAKELELQNETSKVGAREEYARQSYASDVGRAQESAANWSRLTSGISGAAQTGVQGWMNERRYGGGSASMDDVENYVNLLIADGKYDEAQRILEQYTRGR